MKKDSKRGMPRREFIKYSARIGAGAVVGGLAGNIFGRGYKTARDEYKSIKQEVRDIQEYIENLPEKIKESYINNKEGFKEWFNKNILNEEYEKKEYVPQKKEEKPKKEEPKPAEPEKISRRGLFKRIFNRYPIESSTAIGAGAGGTRNAFKGYSTYKDKKTKRETEESLKRIERKLDEKGINRLEKTVDTEGSDNLDKIFITWGLAGWIFSVLFSIFKLTGNTISLHNLGDGIYIIPIIFIVSMIVLFIGLKKRTNF